MPDESHKDETFKSHITLVQLLNFILYQGQKQLPDRYAPYFVSFVQFSCLCLVVELFCVILFVLT